MISSNYSRNKYFESCYSIFFSIYGNSNLDFRKHVIIIFIIVGQIFDFPVVLFHGHMYEKFFLIKFNDGRQIFSNYRSLLVCGFISIILVPSPTVSNLPTCFHTHHQPIEIFSVNSTFSFTCKHISCFNHQ